MPLYEFRCQECRTAFEELVAASQGTEKVVCPQCGSKMVKKIISAGSFRIAGSGGAIPSGALSGCSSKSGFS